MTAEVWRPVGAPFAPGYEVSDQGRVRSWVQSWKRAEGDPPIMLRPGSTPNGYAQVGLALAGVGSRTITVHRLVALTFHGPRPDGLEIRHLDGDKTNNAAENLRYGTRSENQVDKVRHGANPHANQTHCLRGHPFDEENTYHYAGSTSRHCRACRRIHGKRRDAKRRLLGAP